MKYSMNFKFGIGFGKVGRNAYELSKVWKLGVHAFMNDGNFILRICYLRTKKATYYWQFHVKVKNEYCCSCGNGGGCDE